MYPNRIQIIVNEAQKSDGNLNQFSDTELLHAYTGLGHTSQSSFGLIIKSEIEKREKIKTEKKESRIRALQYGIGLALVLIGFFLTKSCTS